MRLTGGAGDLLRRLTDMPFLDRLELVAISGWSRDTVYRGLHRLEDAGLVAPVPHGTDRIAPTRRFYVTATGLRALARDQDLPVENLLCALPVSLQWRRLLLQRLDAVAAIYRLASTVAGVAHPLGLRWYRALPMDATLTLPGGMHGRRRATGSVFRPRPSGVLLLASDEVRLRHARRLLSGFPAPVPLIFAQAIPWQWIKVMAARARTCPEPTTARCPCLPLSRGWSPMPCCAALCSRRSPRAAVRWSVRRSVSRLCRPPQFSGRPCGRRVVPEPPPRYSQCLWFPPATTGCLPP